MSKLAKDLRKNPTDAERLLWQHFMNRRFAGHKFRHQIPIEPYIVDFTCLEPKLIIEVDGSQHLKRIEYDIKRTIYLNKLGYTVIRFWNHEVLQQTQEVLDHIANTINSLK